jgi:hypothetical protein
VNRLLLCLPLYTSVSTNFFVRFLELDRTHVVDTLAVRKLYLAASMQRLFEQCKDRDDWDRLVVLEADMMPPRDALNRIALYPDQLDIVGSAYWQHPPPHHPVIYAQVDDDHYTHLFPGQVDTMMAAPGLYPVDAVGFGFTSVHRRVLQKWDPGMHWFGGENALGHDLSFCREARRQGFAVHVDTAIMCGHLTEVPISYNDAQAVRENPGG